MGNPRTRFRPCIDLHDGVVKQIVGGTLDSSSQKLETNFVSDRSSAHYAKMYRDSGLTGGHVIKLGPNNEAAAREALSAYPDGLQIGGGITPENAAGWIELGASHVIATSCLFDADGHFRQEQLDRLEAAVGRDRLVIDLSCRRTETGWVVAMNRWQTLTDVNITREALSELAGQCDEFLIHAADVEGKCQGIDEDLVSFLANWSREGAALRVPITYAGGARSLTDLELVQRLSSGTVDVTIGSALDIFGGSGVRYEDCVAFNAS